MKTVDRDTLERAALDYLARYASSSENLRRVLMRRVKRARDDAPPDAARLVAEIVERYLAACLLDDGAYAGQQASSLRRRGVSDAGVRFRLAQKGVARELIEAALAGGAASELQAACALVRRRKLGPFRAPAARAEAHTRDLAVLARAGYALALARRVLSVRDETALEQLAKERDDHALSGR